MEFKPPEKHPLPKSGISRRALTFIHKVAEGQSLKEANGSRFSSEIKAIDNLDELMSDPKVVDRLLKTLLAHGRTEQVNEVMRYLATMQVVQSVRKDYKGDFSLRVIKDLGPSLSKQAKRPARADAPNKTAAPERHPAAKTKPPTDDAPDDTGDSTDEELPQSGNGGARSLE